MEYHITKSGGLEFLSKGLKGSFTEVPLEMEKEGKVYRGLVSPAGKNGAFGLLADQAGPFLSCEITFQTKTYAGLPTLVETRVYKALRTIPRALLTVRYFLTPVAKLDEGFLVIPAL